MAQQRGIVDLESRELDLETGIFRAEQAIEEARRDAIDLAARRSTQAATDLQKTRSRIELNLTRRDVLLKVAAGLGATAALESQGVMRTTYVITREIDGEPTEFTVNKHERMTPGDIIEIVRVLGDES